MEITIVTREQMTQREGYRFMVNGGRPTEYSIKTAGTYRARYGETCEYDYPFANASSIVIDGDRARAAYFAAERAAMPVHEFGEMLEIEGCGLYVLMAPMSRYLDGDSPVMLPVDGGMASTQALKRMGASRGKSERARAADEVAREARKAAA